MKKQYPQALSTTTRASKVELTKHVHLLPKGGKLGNYEAKSTQIEQQILWDNLLTLIHKMMQTSEW